MGQSASSQHRPPPQHPGDAGSQLRARADALFQARNAAFAASQAAFKAGQHQQSKAKSEEGKRLDR